MNKNGQFWLLKYLWVPMQLEEKNLLEKAKKKILKKLLDGPDIPLLIFSDTTGQGYLVQHGLAKT